MADEPKAVSEAREWEDSMSRRELDYAPSPDGATVAAADVRQGCTHIRALLAEVDKLQRDIAVYRDVQLMYQERTNVLTAERDRLGAEKSVLEDKVTALTAMLDEAKEAHHGE